MRLQFESYAVFEEIENHIVITPRSTMAWVTPDKASSMNQTISLNSHAELFSHANQSIYATNKQVA